MLSVKSYGLINKRLLRCQLLLNNLLIFSVTSIKSEISLLHSLIHLLATYAGCCDKINNGSTSLSLAEKNFEIILQSAFKYDIGLQFLMKSLSFFPMNVIKAYPCEVIRFLLILVWLIELINSSFNSLQKKIRETLWLNRYFLAIYYY